MARPRGAQRDIDQSGPVAHELLDVLVGRKAVAQQLRAAIEHLPEHDRRELAVFECAWRNREIRPVGGLV